jgi:hypothetical protein
MKIRIVVTDHCDESFQQSYNNGKYPEGLSVECAQYTKSPCGIEAHLHHNSTGGWIFHNNL